MVPRIRALAGLCALTVALAIPALATTTLTNVVLLSPWSSGVLRHGFTVSEKVKGSCWTHSLASERPDAWRCEARRYGDLYDPCFTGSLYKNTLACAEGPFSNRVTLLTVTKPLIDSMKLTESFGDSVSEPHPGDFASLTATRASSLRVRQTQ
jgi:hypothetical protein